MPENEEKKMMLGYGYSKSEGIPPGPMWRIYDPDDPGRKPILTIILHTDDAFSAKMDFDQEMIDVRMITRRTDIDPLASLHFFGKDDLEQIFPNKEKQ